VQDKRRLAVEDKEDAASRSGSVAISKYMDPPPKVHSFLPV